MALYEGLKARDAQKMGKCYHPDATFEDPVFGKLTQKETKAMWEMLCGSAKDLSIEYSHIRCEDEEGSAKLIASYTFSPTGRPVVNKIRSKFTFKNGRILSQKDVFSLWRWTGQALGTKGWLFGWLPNFKGQLQQKVKEGLKQFMRASQDTGRFPRGRRG